MSRNITADNILSKFLEHKKILSQHEEEILSETDTRCKMIDVLFKSVLGWEEVNIKREEYTSGTDKVGFIDYVFKSNNNQFLVEAKKNGNYFNLPKCNKKAKSYGILSKDKLTKEALQQAYDYCKNKRINVGCICNGYQLAVFLLNYNDNDNDTYIFNGLEDIEKDIITFINIFSPRSDANNTVINILNTANSNIRDLPQFTKRVSENIFNADAKINRNPLDSYLRPILYEFFSDLNFENEISDECYCNDERVTNYEKQLTALIVDDLPRLGIPVQEADYAFDEDFIRKEDDMFNRYGMSQVMIIVGGVGSGKTTFLHRYFKRVIPQPIKNNLIWLYIDFTQVSDESINIGSFILRQCLEQIRNQYQGLKIDDWDTLHEIYKPEIIRLQRGALKPLFEDNKKDFDMEISKFLCKKIDDQVVFAEDVVKHISRRQEGKKLICLTVDNADQMSDEFQKKCIMSAFEFTKKFKSLVLISLREESYWKLRNIKPFDAYQNFAYHISAPSVASIISQRIKVASKYRGNVEMEILLNGIKYKINVGKFLEIVSKSLFNNKQNPNIALIEALSANNVRLGQEMLITLLVSGHTNTREYIQTYLAQGDYTIPYHALLRSISLGDYKYYHSNRSLLINLFEIEDDGFFSHFTKIRIIKFLYERRNIKSSAGKGFASISDIYPYFKDICLNEQKFRIVLNPLLRNHLIEADNGYRAGGEEAEFVRVTSSGYYYVNYLLKEFSYLERLCEDTTISSNKHFEEIDKLTKEIFLIEDSGCGKRAVMKIRLKRMEVFLQYLESQEKADEPFINCNELQFLIMDEIISNFKKQSNRIIS